MRETQLPTAVLIDVLSIQKYIFQSNKLKENLGASYIIEHVLYGVEFLGLDKTTPWWDGKMPINTTGTIGFVGGGNALLFFNDETQANAFLKIFFTKVYLSLPGLPIIYGIKNDFCIGTNYKTHFSILIKSLIICRNSYRFNMPLAKSPFHDNCVFTGNIAVDTQQGDKISASAKARLTYVDSAKNKHLELIEGDNKNNYTFTDELSKLAQPDEKSYIAVVHIDGNGIGDEFLSCESLKDSQTLSQAVNDLCKSTFKTLITEMINELDTYNLNLQKDGDKTILPIRPIIIGGDDITFVCEGTLGVYLAEKFIEIFSVKIKEKYYNACAGIAIAKTKYPFSKIYYLADALCQEAKEKAKIKAEEKVQTGYPSAISYHIATNGISGSLADIRTQYYTNL
ncbi:MAG: hypothetical protein IPQ19_14195 [Bacteroidetes bacterium]|nr:hypothetical protein [Bacteroidota bacterium]